MQYSTLFLISLAVTLIVEVPTVVFLIKLSKEKITVSKTIGISILATCLTLPYLWFIFNQYFDFGTLAIFGETFVFITETIIYWKLLPISFPKAFLISFISNTLSIIAGLLINGIFF